MDGFTLKGVPVPVVVRIDEASLKSASGVLDGFVKELQKKCNLTLSIDTSAAQSVLSQLQTSMRSLRAGGRSAIVGGQQTNAALYKNYANTVRDLQIKADANWLTSDKTRAAIAEMNRLYGGYRQGAVAASQMQAAIDNVNRSFREEAAAAKDAASEVERASRSLNAQRNKAIQSASNEFYRTWESYDKQYKEFQQRITEGQYSSQASKDAVASLKTTIDGYAEGTKSATDLKFAVEKVTSAFREEADAARDAANATERARNSLNAQRNRAIQSESNEYYRTWETYSKKYEEMQARIARGEYSSQASKDAVASLKSVIDGYAEGTKNANDLKFAVEGVSQAFADEARAAREAESAQDKLQSRLQSFENARQRMQLRLADLGQGATTAEYERFVNLLDEVRRNGGKGFENLASASIEAQHSVQALNAELREAANIAKIRDRLSAQLTPEWFLAQRAIISNQLTNADPATVTNVQDALNKLQGFGNAAQLTDQQVVALNGALAEYNRLMGIARSSDTTTRSFQDQATAIANLKSQYQDYMAKFGQNLQHNLPLMEKFKKFGEDLSAGGPSNELQRRWAELTAEAKRAGVEVQTVRQRMTNLFGQHFNTALIMLAIRGLRQALRQLWQDIKEVNEALVQTQIVTGLSGAALEAYTDKAYAAADQSKDKVTNILSEATAFGRLGYDSELSVQLAQLTSMYSKLGDVDTSDATDAITALMKAFDLKNADEIELALDKMIYVGNNFPISAAGLGEGLNNAASALSSAGNSLEQTLALLMAANATVQNPSKSSTAMRTITARIRNTKAELDELGEELDERYDTVAKYQKELLGLTGVDILDATGKNFRATYDILKDLADVWGTLTSTQQAAVTTMVAGTRTQDIFASLMKNFPSAEEAMGGMGDAAGLMDEKFKAVEDSISGALSGLSNAWSKFSTDLFDSSVVVGFIDTLSDLLRVINQIQGVIGGSGLLSIIGGVTLLISKFRQFSQQYDVIGASISRINAFGSVGDINGITNELSALTVAQQNAALSGSTLTMSQRKAAREALSTSAAYRTVSTSMIESTVASKELSLSDEKQAIVKQNLIGTTVGLNGVEQQEIVTRLNQLITDKQLTAEQAMMIAGQLGLSTVLVTTTTAAGQQTMQIKLLGDEYRSFGAKTKSFLGSGSWIILAVTALIAIISSIRQASQNASQKFVDDAEAQSKAVKDAARDYEDVSRQYEQQLSSISSYSDRVHEIDEQLKNANGTEEYRVAQENLSSVVKDLTEQFGLQATDVQALTADLQNYDTVMADILKKRRYEEITSGENYSNTKKMVGMYGYDINGSAKTPSFVMKSGQFEVLMLSSGPYAATAGIQSLIDSNEAKKSLDRQYDNLYKLLTRGDTVEILPGVKISTADVVSGSAQYDWTNNNTSHEFTQAYTIKSVGASVDKVVPWLEDLVEYYKSKGDSDAADQVSLILAETLESTGYKEAKSAFDEWAELTILYGNGPSQVLAVPYLTLSENKEGFTNAVLSGDSEGARNYLSAMFGAYAEGKELAENAGYDWAVRFFDGVIESVGDTGLLKNLISGSLLVEEGSEDQSAIWYDANADERLKQTTADRILSAGKMRDIETARRAGLEYEYKLYQDLNSAASIYGTTVEKILSWFSILYGLPNSEPPGQGNISYSTFHDLPSNYQDKYSFTGQTVLQDATGRVGAVASRAQNFWDLRSDWWGSTGRDRQTFSQFHEDQLDEAWEASEEFVEKFNDYFGTNYEKITKDNAKVIEDVFTKESNAVYGIVEGSMNDIISFLQDHEISLTDILGREDIGNLTTEDFGKIKNAILDVGAAAESAEEQAQAAAAASAADMASSFQALNGLTISVEQNEDGGFSLHVSGGFADIGGTKRGGGGGGGHHSQISDDIDNVERLIKLFKELLNYYDEGSEQWIARQRQIIDKYKAGVEIAMAEYDRLIKKGLKQTDEDVKKIVDTILEYQGDIFEESKKLWEAVRQNQIDALKHTKDQIDATIELEKTHHDLLIAIRDERRELEDELKAARDAYSEVMTPEELDAMFSVEDYAELMDKLAGIEGDAMALYRDYKEQIAAVSEDETYMIEHITDEFKRQYDLKMKEYEIAKAELGVARAQQELENVKNEQTVMMLIGGRWQWVADPEKVLEAEQALADAEQELADAQDEYDFQSLIHEMEAQSSEIQRQIDALEALTFSMDELAEQIHLFSDSVYKELLTYLSQIAQATFDKYAGDTAVPAFAEGGVIKRGGLAMVHSGEPIFSTADAERLWRFVHDLGDTPINVDGVIGSFAQKLVSSSPIENQTAHQTVIDNSINIPGGIHVNGETAQQLIALLKSVVAPYQP